MNRLDRIWEPAVAFGPNDAKPRQMRVCRICGGEEPTHNADCALPLLLAVTDAARRLMTVDGYDTFTPEADLATGGLREALAALDAAEPVTA